VFNRFKEFVESNRLFKPNHKLLIGVSGGIDSVVLLQLVNQYKIQYAVAHCNFQLRNGESDADEAFVAGLSKHMSVPFYSVRFEPEKVATDRGISIEMAARDLRYEWFEQIRAKEGYKWIVVAHHQDDVLETFFLNLSRGTGIKGLSGIKPVSGKIIRPLLFASRKEIEEFAVQRGLIYRTDSSNRDQRIPRNKVRLGIIPSFEELNPSFRKNMIRSIGYLYDAEQIYYQRIDHVRTELISEGTEGILIDIWKLKQLSPIITYLFELLTPFEFNTDVVNEIYNAIGKQPGSRFFSPSHRLVVDREHLIINKVDANGDPIVNGRKKKSKDFERKQPTDHASEKDHLKLSLNSATTSDNIEEQMFVITKEPQLIDVPFRMKVTVERFSSGYQIPNSKNIAVLDYFRLPARLLLRKWSPGDSFRPLGMEQFKKLSDFFIDEKFSIPQKEQAWILCAGSQIAWVVGARIDDRYKVSSKTQMVLRFELPEI
jgi:tRNA(Ile)-lysidine synthase